MITKEELLKQIDSVEQLAKTSKLGRFFNHPAKYLTAILYRELIYKFSHQSLIRNTKLFNGTSMEIALPASSDIYLTGGKSHDSEIRLAKFIIRHLQPHHHFLDIGAHYGYFSLIASAIIQQNGKVYAFEPAKSSYSILKQNCFLHPNITPFRQAVSNLEGELEFYEFPNLQSEYNSLDINQFKNESWFVKAKPSCEIVQSTTIDLLTDKKDFLPDMIKIDVEGSENLVILGGQEFLKNHHPLLVMEYLETKRHNRAHQEAVNLMRDLDYTTFRITIDGNLQELDDPDQYLSELQLESDNIVFKKRIESSFNY